MPPFFLGSRAAAINSLIVHRARRLRVGLPIPSTPLLRTLGASAFAEAMAGAGQYLADSTPVGTTIPVRHGSRQSSYALRVKFWKRGKRQRAPDVSIEFPTTQEIVPGEYCVHIHSHEIIDGAQVIPCWTYVTDGLARHGQQEIVLTLRRRDSEQPSHVPTEPVSFLASIDRWAQDGHIVNHGGISQFGEHGLLGFGGILYETAEPFDSVTLPNNALAAILVTERELRVSVQFSRTRLLARLCQQFRRYPFPIWVDRERDEVPLPEFDGQSVLNGVPVIAARGVSASKIDDSISIRCSVDAADELRNALQALPESQPFAMALDPDPSCDGCLVWLGPTQSEPLAVTPRGSDGSHLSGCVLVVAQSDDDEDRWRVMEDGFGLLLTPASWKQLMSAMQTGTAFHCADAGCASPISLTWHHSLD